MSKNEMIGLVGGALISCAIGLGCGLNYGLAMGGVVLIIYALRTALVEFLKSPHR